MKCRRIDKDTNNIIWFGVKSIIKDVPKEFTCGENKICGIPFTHVNIKTNEVINMSPSIVVYDNNYTDTYVLDKSIENSLVNVSIFYNPNNKHDNYAEGSDAVADSLTQRLSVLKYELWYDYMNGMPIVDKIKNKAILDAYVIKTILAHPDVIDIDAFESRQSKSEYNCYIVINSIYGNLELSL